MIDKNDILRREYNIKDRDFKLYCDKYNKLPYNLLDLIKFKEVLKSFEKDYNNKDFSNTQIFNKYKEEFKFMSIREMNEWAINNINIISDEMTEREKENIRKLSLFLNQNKEVLK